MIVAGMWLVLPMPTKALELYGRWLLIATRNHSQAASLLKVFSHASQQFAATGDIEENLAVFHHSYAEKCMTFGLTAQEAFGNLYVLFVPNRAASVYYHKHVLPAARTLEQAFSLMYSRFSSSERQDRLIRQWNNLHFSKSKNKPGATLQTALVEVCPRAELLHIQLGQAYQDDQHLRDAIRKEVIDEPFAAYLVISQTQNSVSIQELVHEQYKSRKISCASRHHRSRPIPLLQPMPKRLCSYLTRARMETVQVYIEHRFHGLRT